MDSQVPSPLIDKKVWITGASSGIGRAVALELAKHGCRLILSSRNEEALNQLAAEISNQYFHSPYILAFDVTDKNAYLKVSKIIQEQGGIDIAFLNAGILQLVDMSQFNSEVYERIINTNYLGMIRCLEVALPYLRQSKFPHLIGMSSLSSYRGLPRNHSAYGASKAAIRNMLEAVRLDFIERGEKIAVSVVCPGFVKTKLSDPNEGKMKMIARISSEEAAKAIVKGIQKQEYEIHFPKRMSIPSKILSILPMSLYIWIMRRWPRK